MTATLRMLLLAITITIGASGCSDERASETAAGEAAEQSGATAESAAVETTESAAGDAMVVLVLGASGRTGRHTVTELTAKGVEVRAGTRDVERAKQNVSEDFAWVRADVTDPASLDAALLGVTHVIGAMSSSSRDPSNSPETVDHLGVVNLTDAALRAGVKRLVLISAMGVTRTESIESEHMRNLLSLKFQGEEYLRASGVPYTIIRPGGLDMAPAGEDELIISQGDEGGFGVLSREDLALVTVECLTNPATLNKTFEIAGGNEGDPGDWRAALAKLQ